LVRKRPRVSLTRANRARLAVSGGQTCALKVTKSLFFSRLGMSTLGTFRNMDLFLPMPLYWCALALIIAGLAIALAQRRPGDRLVHVLTAWFLSAAAINLAAVWWNSWFVDFQPQGRYILLTAACLAMIAAVAPMRALPRTGAQLWAATVIIFLSVTASYSVHLIFAAPCLRLEPGRSNEQVSNQRLGVEEADLRYDSILWAVICRVPPRRSA
jgi:hypothetical protein